MKIINVMDHYEAYHNGKFICSGDTYNEVKMEAINIERGAK